MSGRTSPLQPRVRARGKTRRCCGAKSRPSGAGKGGAGRRGFAEWLLRGGQGAWGSSPAPEGCGQGVRKKKGSRGEPPREASGLCRWRRPAEALKGRELQPGDKSAAAVATESRRRRSCAPPSRWRGEPRRRCQPSVRKGPWAFDSPAQELKNAAAWGVYPTCQAPSDPGNKFRP